MQRNKGRAPRGLLFCRHSGRGAAAIRPRLRDCKRERPKAAREANAMDGVSQSILILLSLEQQPGLTRRIIASL
jgi:hypothetical protein